MHEIQAWRGAIFVKMHKTASRTNDIGSLDVQYAYFDIEMHWKSGICGISDKNVLWKIQALESLNLWFQIT